MTFNKIFHDRLSVSYLLFVMSLMLHVTDETINHFLDFYNPLVQKLKERLTFFPFPTFSFSIWITGLGLLIVILLILTPVVYSRKKFILLIMRVFAILMIFNGLGHLAFSIYYGKIIAGMLSSPFLIFFSAFFFFQAQKNSRAFLSNKNNV